MYKYKLILTVRIFFLNLIVQDPLHSFWANFPPFSPHVSPCRPGVTTHGGATPCVHRAPGGQSTSDLHTVMVCHKEKTHGGKKKKRVKGREEMATQKKTQKKNILKQYRKLIAVLPNICSKSRVTKVKK